MNLRMNTISQRVELTGVGLHSGKQVKLVLSPAKGQGIVFSRTDVSDFVPVRLSVDSYFYGNRCSLVRSPSGEINTIEHLLAAMYVCKLTDVLVEVSGEELPAGDGSAKTFLNLIDSANLSPSNEEIEIFTLKEEIRFEEDDWSISISPADEFSISYTLDLSQFGFSEQVVSIVVSEENFRDKISQARTFVPFQVAEKLRSMGYGKGATSENTLLLGASDAVERFENEAAFHKILDIIGDLACVRCPIRAKIVAVKSGHRQNVMLAHAIASKISTEN